MDIQSVIRIVKDRVRNQFSFFFWVCFFLLGQTLSAADPSALKIEEAQRAFQERHKMILGESVSWPDNAANQAAPEYPPDGFYETDLADPLKAAALVADLADKFDYTGILWEFTSAKGGDIEGVSDAGESQIPRLGNQINLPHSDEITPYNYPAQFQRLIQGLCKAKYVVVGGEQIGPGGNGTGVETTHGSSFNEWYEGTVYFGGDYGSPCSGTLEVTFYQTPVEDHWEVEVVSEQPGVSEHVSRGEPFIDGNTAKIEWEVTPWPESLPGEPPQDGCWTLTAYYRWSLVFSLAQNKARAQANWGNWEQGGGRIGVNTQVGDCEIGNCLFCMNADINSSRGRLYANLTNFTGTARCYLAVEPANIEFPESSAYDAPVPADVSYHFLESATPGIEWQSSSVLGDYMPPFIQDCSDPIELSVRGWQLAPESPVIVIVTPDFHYNIEDCEPCSACEGQCTLSSASTSLTTDGALNVNISCGLDSFGKSAGVLGLLAFRPDRSLSTPSGLNFQTSLGSEVIRGGDGVLRQVRSSQGLVDIVSATTTHYEIDFYTAANAGTKNGSGFYVPNGAAFKTIAVENPDGSGTTFNQLQVTESGIGQDRVSDFAWSDAEQKWTLVTGSGLRLESRSSEQISSDDRREVYTIMDGAGQTVIYKEQQTLRTFNWGEEVIEKTVDPDGASLTTTWDYYDDDENDGDNYSHLKQIVDPNGHWERYQYDSQGRTIEVVFQYLDAPLDSPNDQCRVTTTVYGTNDPAVTVIETIQDNEVSRRYTVYRPGEMREIQALTAHAEWDDPANLVIITRTYLGGAFEGKLQSVTHPDGTMSIYQYECIESGGGSNLITSVSTGQANGEGTAIINGSKAVTRVNQSGTIVREETHDIADGNDTLIAWSQAVAFDDFGRATQINYSDATSVSTTYGCCGVLSITDREGIMTTYVYDALKRLSTTTRAGITTSNSYDAAGHVLNAVRIGSDNSAITVNTSTYDVTGRLTSSTDAVTNTTSYFEFMASGHLVKSNVFADGSYRVETFYQDGQLLNVTGSAVHGVRYVYGVNADGQFIQEIKLNVDGSETSEWTKTYTDMAGRTHKTVYAGGSFSQSFYNNSGQLVKQIDPDGVTTLFAYNANGELETTAIDMDQNGQIDFGGTDRITQTENSVVTAYGMTVRRTITSVWTTNNVDASSIASVNDVSADGLQSWSISYGLTNHVQTAYSGNGQRTVTATSPDGSYTVAQYQDGQLVSAIQYGNDNAQVSATLYRYDSHGRLGTQTDARTGETMYGYNDADQLVSVTTPVPATGQSAQTIQYEYDAMGRRTIVALPDNGTVTTEYFDTGEPKKNYGARTYPVECSYDYGGRMKTMKTWKDFAGDTGTATTMWNYDAQRGFLTSKVYDDSTSVTYSNSAAGRLLNRTWARGVVTTYPYNNAGDLGTITYSDTTPSVTFGYDRRGHRTSATSASSAVDYSYNDAGQLLTESFSNSGVVITNTYDGLLRRTGLSFAGQSVAYGYDNASRLSSVAQASRLASYTYLPNSSLVSNIIFQTSGVTKMTTTKSYDTLNRLTRVDNVILSGAKNLSFAYDYNSANQRTKCTDEDGSYWEYGYDGFGQVTSGHKKWSDNSLVGGQQYDYIFDDIGNRTANNANGRESAYTANSLNQYTQRTVPGFIWELGNATSNATVTINNQTTARKGGYFSKELSVINSSSAVYTQLVTVGVRKNAGANSNDVVSVVTGKVFVAKSPELFAYDADGNLTNDGRWIYTWDAENRLASMVTQASLPADVPKLKLLFGYDSQSRRISKVMSNFNGSAWFEVSNLRFIYDGWNLIAELDKTNALVRSYMWGSDLSGSMQGAGGVGGLLAITSHQSPITTHFVSYDGNGNVVALLDAQSSTLSAQYDYGPFGETLRATGPTAEANPFRFSTKYTDAETRLVYYGYRYYASSAGRCLSKDPIEERGEPNLYGFVQNDSVDLFDKLGLAQVWFFSGINSWQGGTNYSSIGTTIQERWNYTAESNYVGPPHQLISNAGTQPQYGHDADHPTLWRLNSKGILDEDARRRAFAAVRPGELCCSRIHILMIAPKTNTRPPKNSCCNIGVQVYWNPRDYVPNQGVFSPEGNELFWAQWGNVHTVNTGHGHSFEGFIPRNGIALQVVEFNPNYLRDDRNPDSSQPYLPTRQTLRSPADEYLRSWMADPQIDHIFICHSQGCNIAMQVLRRGCPKK